MAVIRHGVSDVCHPLTHARGTTGVTRTVSIQEDQGFEEVQVGFQIYRARMWASANAQEAI